MVKVLGKPTSITQDLLWQYPTDITIKDLYYGEGGKAHQLMGRLHFISEDLGGTQPKLIVEDENGVRWKIKLGIEAQVEIVATRLLWAAGYFTDQTYYLPIASIDGLVRAGKSARLGRYLYGNLIYGARFKRLRNHQTEFITWDWLDNPFVGKAEFNGLKVLMALINNWDLKSQNNSIYYHKENDQRRFLIHDLGAALGRTGGYFTRSRNNLSHYINSPFIARMDTHSVDFVLHNRPPWYFPLTFYAWPKYLRMLKIGTAIPCIEARAMGELLARLSLEQLQDAFRAACYSTEEIKQYCATIKARIDQLVEL